MEGSAFYGGMLAGLLYFTFGLCLIRMSWRSQRLPESILGTSFILWGIAYVCWQIPIATANEPLTQPLFFVGRIFTHAGTIFFASFCWIEFRNRSRWARYLVIAIALSLSTGVLGSIALGDWEGIRPITNPWWWLEWVAGLVAMGWVGVEGFIAYPRARQRLQLGLSDPLVCNRFLLWGITGVSLTAYSGILLFHATGFESNGVWSIVLDRVNGAVEAITIALFWLIYFPPRFYQHWILGAAPAAEAKRN
jgi:hypothetical protein